eukprot:227250_1
MNDCNCYRTSDNSKQLQSSENIITACDHLKRITDGLPFYLSLFGNNKIVDTDSTDKFIEFCNNEYRNILDDYVHIICVHSTEFELIAELLHNNYQFPQCVLNECKITQRHYDENTIDPSQSMFIKIFDQLHYCIFHLVDMGLKISKQDAKKIEEEIKSDDNLDNNVDRIFAKIHKIILFKRKQYKGNITRFAKGNKFNLQTIQDTKQFNDEITCLDDMCKYIKASNIVSSTILTELRDYLHSEEFDTDSIEQDIDNNDDIKVNSNIHEYARNDQLFHFMKTYIYNLQESRRLFSTELSTGIVFFYWDYYKKMQTEQETKHIDSQWYDNQNDFGGYSLSNLYVEPYYKSLKIEIMLGSGFLTLSQWNKNVIEKAKLYMKTKRVKEMKCRRQQDPLHYGIP